MHSPLDDARAVWARVDAGFYVGSRGGDFLGYVDRRRDGRFVAADLHSHPLGIFDDLESARSSVEAARPSVEAARSGTTIDREPA